MENQINNVNKEEVIAGIFYSFIIFIISLILSYGLISNTILMLIVGYSKPSIALIITLLLIISWFLILNTVAFLVTKNKSKKKGLLIGYSLAMFFIILLLVVVLLNMSDITREVNDANDRKQYALAIKNNDESFCFKIKNDVNIIPCLVHMGEQKNDISICDKIIAKDYYISHIKDTCYDNIAISLNDLSICKKILDEERKRTCQCHRNTSAPCDHF